MELDASGGPVVPGQGTGRPTVTDTTRREFRKGRGEEAGTVRGRQAADGAGGGFRAYFLPEPISTARGARAGIWARVIWMAAAIGTASSAPVTPQSQP